LKRVDSRSLRFRLTLWYSSVLILVVLMLAAASQWALNVSLDRAMDQRLRFRLIGLHTFISENDQDSLETLAVKLRGLEHLGDLFQVVGSGGQLIAQSDGLARHRVRAEPLSDLGGRMVFLNAGPKRFQFRMAAQQIHINGRPIIIEVADPRGKFEGILNEFYSILFFVVPIALVLAAAGGYWLSGRALRPVDQIIKEARAIDPANFSARLSVPSSGDELQRLSQTINQMLDRVEQSVFQVRRFTADASHELRAPMTLIYTAAQFALRRDRSADDLKDALKKILHAAKRSTDLINQLLWLARSDAGNKPELIPADVAAVVSDVAGEAGTLADEKGLTIATEVPEAPTYVAIDEASFRRMLLILLDNAVKYTPQGGSVKVSIAESANDLEIAVADTGIGISAEDMPFVFDRFWRADLVRTRESGGTGLGLAIARDIARAHGAELVVESSIGQGSTFMVRLRRLQHEGNIEGERDYQTKKQY
jgi:heavy metal sensor kinase